MRQPRLVHRVVLVVLDGLRPDAIESYGLPHLTRLGRCGAATLSATTVAPSVTAACMTSLLTGVDPERHGLRDSKFRIPRSRAPIHPLTKVLAEADLPTSAFVCQVPWIMRGLGRRIARKLGIADAHFVGRQAADVLVAARQTLLRQRDGLVLMHWPDADEAGHAHGWMSPAYELAAHRLDLAFGALASLIGLPESADTLLIALADHGGGGEVANDHESAHPLDRTIPFLMVGGGVDRSMLGADVSLLDAAPTVLHALGVSVPESYGGRPLVEAFARRTAVA